MEIIEIIELLGITIAFITGISSFIISLKSNNISKRSNKISEESLKLSKECANMSKENIELNHIGNPVLITGDKCILFNNDKGYEGDYYLIVNILINNKSLQPITIKDFSCFLGTGKDSIYISNIDYIKIKEYTMFEKIIVNSTIFPIYLNGNESKEVSVAISLGKAEYNQYYGKSGIELNFSTTYSSKKINIKSDNTIDYTK